jgi:hypothetical protein
MATATIRSVSMKLERETNIVTLKLKVLYVLENFIVTNELTLKCQTEQIVINRSTKKC